MRALNLPAVLRICREPNRMSELIISVSGLRGIVGQTLTPDIACRYVAAFASGLADGPILVGRDGRDSGPMLRQAIVAGLTACGRDCVDVDVAATPTIGVLVRERGAAGAVQITASHNPSPYNGIKLFGNDGRVLDIDSGATVRDRFLAGQLNWVPHDRIGQQTADLDPHEPHLARVLETVDALAIRAAGYRVLLDSNHGREARSESACSPPSVVTSSRSGTSPMERLLTFPSRQQKTCKRSLRKFERVTASLAFARTLMRIGWR